MRSRSLLVLCFKQIQIAISELSGYRVAYPQLRGAALLAQSGGYLNDPGMIAQTTPSMSDKETIADILCQGAARHRGWSEAVRARSENFPEAVAPHADRYQH
jgi:hypothetical protein